LIEEMAGHGASTFLKPAFDRHNGAKKGRLSIQTNPAYYRNAEAITNQALHFSAWPQYAGKSSRDPRWLAGY
jgi:transaldolase